MPGESLFIIRDESSPACYARVAVERGIDAPDGYVYASALPVEVGDRVVVPLGRGNRPAHGIVVAAGGCELLAGLDPARVKRVVSSGGARLPRDLLDVARWMASYYVCPLGLVLAAMLPAAVKADAGARTERVVALGETLQEPSGEKARQALAAIRSMEPGELPMTPAALAARLGHASTGTITRLTSAGFLEESIRRVVRSVGARHEITGADAITPVTPTAEQEAAIRGISAGWAEFGVHLLLGVTGSGKTEVFLRVIEAILPRTDASVVVLVPEIALTPQAVERFQGRLRSVGVAVLHSGLSASERNRQWTMAAAGAARVVVGARSAVFAPVARLGLVIVDEEHDSSYKQDQAPRFHARDVGIMRAKIAACPVILASATPALESWRNAQMGRYRLWRLPRRVGPAVMPEVRVVDMRAERRRAGDGGPRALAGGAIGPTLAGELRRALDAGGQAILLLNRRGLASYAACPDVRCGWVMNCDHCDASMVVHRKGDREGRIGGVYLRCHHCLAEQMVPSACPYCGKAPIRLGYGTQRVEEELRAAFEDLREAGALERVDADTMGSVRDYAAVLAAFGAGRTRVLLGTQMIGKGLDYPNVRLVGVISADTGLAIPDFRASERTYQLVSQVAGRAGRGATPGLVIVQTMNPDERAIVLASRHDYEDFARGEAEVRERSGLPPSARMARIVVRDEREPRALETAGIIAERMREAAGSGGGVRVEGPAACVLARISDQFRYGVEVYAPSHAALHAPLDRLRSLGLLASEARVAVDVDPVSVM